MFLLREEFVGGWDERSHNSVENRIEQIEHIRRKDVKMRRKKRLIL